MKQILDEKELIGKTIADVETLEKGDHLSQIFIFTDDTYAVYTSGAGYEDSTVAFDDEPIKPFIEQWNPLENINNKTLIKLGLVTEEEINKIIKLNKSAEFQRKINHTFFAKVLYGNNIKL